MVASIDSYLHVWQWAPVGFFIVAWLLGGGWLFQRELLKASGVPQRRVRFGRGMLASFVTGLAGVFVGLLVWFLFYSMAKRFEEPALNYAGIAAGVAAALVAAYLAAYVVLGLPARRTLAVTWRPVAAVFALAAIVTAACAPASIAQTRTAQAKEDCALNMTAIANSFHFQRFLETPQSLRDLVANKLLHDEQIRCPACKKEYFYMPVKQAANINGSINKTLGKMLVVCDLAGNHPGGRQVVFADWSSGWKTDSEFDELLKLPVNETFAKELQKAESK